MLSSYNRRIESIIAKPVFGLAIAALLCLPVAANAQGTSGSAAPVPAAPASQSAAPAPQAATSASQAAPPQAPAASPVPSSDNRKLVGQTPDLPRSGQSIEAQKVPETDNDAMPAITVKQGAGLNGQPEKTFKIIYLGKHYPEPPPLSIAEPIITDKGIQGARVGIIDNNRTGQFINEKFVLQEAIIPVDGDIAAEAKKVLKGGDALIIADLEAPDLLKVADLPEAKGSIILNIRDSDDALRQKDCRFNVFDIIPSWAMRADALGQYLIVKKWPRWFLMRGKTEDDIRFANAAKRSAKRYGADIVGERVYKFEAGARRLDSGHQQVQSQMADATQGAPSYDVLWVSDTDDEFGDYLMYRTTDPRPVVGTQGMVPVAWTDTYTEFGGMAFQIAIQELAHREATERDYTAWLGVRAFGEAALRSGKATVTGFRDYFLSDKFKLAGFKGEAMSFRKWDHQLRQPILLAGPRTIISVSPQDGFLHPNFLTDTLGYDVQESLCKFNKQ